MLINQHIFTFSKLPEILISSSPLNHHYITVWENKYIQRLIGSSPQEENDYGKPGNRRRASSGDEKKIDQKQI